MALKVLIADPDSSWSEQARNYLKENLYDVDSVTSGKDAQLMIASNKYFSVILSLDIENHPGKQVLKFIKANAPSLRVVLTMKDNSRINEGEVTLEELEKLGAQTILTHPISLDKLGEVLDANQDLGDMMAKLPKREGVSAEEEVSVNDDQFTKVKVDEFFSGEVVLFDVYVRLNSGHYVKILHAGDSFSKERVKKYKDEKKVDYFYFLNKDRRKYLHFYNHVIAKTVQNEKVGTDTKLSFMKNLTEKYVEELYDQGIKPQVIDQGKALCDSMYQLIKKDKGLYKSLRNYQQFDPSAYSHAYLTSLFSSMIAKQFEWESASTIETIVMASLLHDIGKLKLPKEVSSKSVEEMNDLELEEYKKHPKIGAEMVENARMLSPSVKQVILQHHEACDGSGFPYGLKDSRIQTLSKIVFLSNEFVHLVQDKSIPPAQALKEMLSSPDSTKRYNAGILEKFLKVFIDPEKVLEMDKSNNKFKKVS